MLDFFQNNWKDLLEIIISVVIGLLGGVTYQKNKIKNVLFISIFLFYYPFLIFIYTSGAVHFTIIFRPSTIFKPFCKELSR